MYEVLKFKNEDSFNQAMQLTNSNCYAYDATSSYFPIVIEKLEDDYVVFYDFYPFSKVIKKVTKFIQFSNKEEPFFRWRKRKYFLESFLRINL